MKFSTHIMVCSLAMVALLMTSSLTGAVLPKTSDTMRFQDGRIVYVEKFHCYAIQPVSILLPLWCLGTKDHPNVSLSYVFYLYPVNLLEAYKVDGLQVRFKACPVASFCAPFPFAHVVLLLAIERGDGAGDDTIGKIPCYPEALGGTLHPLNWCINLVLENKTSWIPLAICIPKTWCVNLPSITICDSPPWKKTSFTVPSWTMICSTLKKISHKIVMKTVTALRSFHRSLRD